MKQLEGEINAASEAVNISKQLLYCEASTKDCSVDRHRQLIEELEECVEKIAVEFKMSEI